MAVEQSVPLPAFGTERPEGLVIRDLAVAYHRAVVLQDVSTAIRPGQVVGVIGPNGGGKSTLLKAILGIAPVIRGTIHLFGQPAPSMRRRMAYLPQRETVDWDFPVTVRDVVLMGRYPHVRWLARPSRHDREVTDRMLERVAMSGCRARQIGQLSGGQQQRVFLARALAQEADVLLLDEPMNGVDAATRDVILDVIDEQRRAGRIVLLATHDLGSASCACDCLCCLNQRMVSYGPTAVTYTEAILARTYGGPVILLERAGAPGPATPHPHGDPARHDAAGPGSRPPA